MKHQVLVERNKEGFYWLSCKVDNTLIVANGETLSDAKEDFKIAYEETLEKEYVEAEYDFKYDTASALEELSFLNLSQFAKIVGINASLLRQYKKGQYISASQAEKIQIGIRSIGQKMANFALV